MNSQFSYSSIYHDQTSFFTWFPTCHSFYWSSTYHTEHSAFQFLLLSTIHLYHLQMLECFRVFSLSMLYLCSHNQVISFPVSYLKYNLYPDNSHFLLNNSNQMSKKCIKLNMLKSKLLNSLFPPKPVTPVSPISANGNSLIPVVQAKNIEHHLFTLFFFSFLTLHIQSLSKFYQSYLQDISKIHNSLPSTLQPHWCKPLSSFFWLGLFHSTTDFPAFTFAPLY